MIIAQSQTNLKQLELPLVSKTSDETSSKSKNTWPSAKNKAKYQINTVLNKKPEYEIVEAVTRSDIKHLVMLARAMQADSAIKDEIDIESVETTVKFMISDKDRKYLNAFLLYKYDKPIGFLVASCSKSLYNKTINGQMHLWFVLKEARNIWASMALLRAYDQWCTDNGAKRIYVGSINTNSSDRLEKLLNRYGYPKYGTVHIREVY